MKKIKYIQLFLIGLATFTLGCSKDFLEQTSPDKLNSATFWRNVNDAEAGLAAAYSQIECHTSYWGFSEYKFIIDNFRSDYVLLGTDPSNYTEFQEIYNFNPNPSNYIITDFWEINYRGIYYANQVIGKVQEMDAGKITEEEKNQIIAEARFLRGYYHFKLLLNWEQIIIKDGASASEDALEKPLATRAETWDFIINDFSDAAAVLPWSQPNDKVGRATKGSALGYLGKAALYCASEENSTEDFQKAEEALKTLITQGPYSLLPSFISSFNGSVPNSSESLFELQVTTSEENNAWYQTPYLKFICLGEFGGWDEYKGSDALISEMKSEGMIATTGNYDTRLYESVFFQDPYFNDAVNPRVYGYTYDDWFTGESKNQFRKYLPDNYAQISAEYNGNNMVILRYADAILMYAEALNQLGKTNEAIGQINDVRNRANMPDYSGSTSQSDVFNQIVHERVMELSAEGWRFYDLRRWGLLESAMTAAGRTYTGNAFFPIPEDESSANSLID